jgi:hypothetical protein
MLQSRFESAYEKHESDTPAGFSLEFLNDYFTIVNGKPRVHWWKVLSNVVELMSRLAVAWMRRKALEKHGGNGKAPDIWY